jgi:hypothetical protein
MVEEVKLNKKEQKLFAEIEWDIEATIRGDGSPRANLDKIGRLAESLLKRKAIPRIRVDMLVKPELNPGGRGKSVKDIFARNGNSAREMFRHGHFVPWLRYFIYGPDLPKTSIEGFRKVIDDDSGLTIHFMERLQKYVRNEIRQRRLDRRDAAEQFYRLAHEWKRAEWAECVRKAAINTR